MPKMSSPLHNPLLLHMAMAIEKAWREAYPGPPPPPLEDIYHNITRPPQFKMGHFTLGLFPWSNALKISLPLAAKTLAEKIEEGGGDGVFEKVQALGPYLNVNLSPESYGEWVVIPILEGHFFKRTLITSKSKIMIEYSQPNTHKELHVGHMRNLCLGNALVRLHHYLGHDVISATYPGDVGTHVAKCLWYLKNHYKGPIPTEQRGRWLGKIYTQATRKWEDEGEGKGKKGELTSILKQLEKKKGEYFDLWKETREWSIDLMKDVYRWANVTFDRWYFESEVDRNSLRRARKSFEQGHLVESEGAIGMDLRDEGLGFCILIKSDGTGMYATKDVDLAFKKFEEFQLDKGLYLVDKRQTHHFRQVFKVLERLGFGRASDCVHLSYDFVELPEGAMSSRRGNIVPLTDLIEEMEAKITRDYLERYRGDWSDDHIAQTATMVANGAIKYGMIRMDRERKIVFHKDEWLKLDGETGPYLQYVHARIHSLIQKFGSGGGGKGEGGPLTSPQELELMVKLSQFNEVVVMACTQGRPHTLCTYLYELGKLFNGFYGACPIGGAKDQALKTARLGLAQAVGLVIEKGTGLLGISSPLKM